MTYCIQCTVVYNCAQFSVSLAASVLRLEIRRHKARGGGAPSDPLNGSGCAGGGMRDRFTDGSGCAGGEKKDRFDALSTFDFVTARVVLALRRASASSYGFQSPTRPPEID